jgi:hypothetical protein
LPTDLFAAGPARRMTNSDMVFSPVFLCSCHDRCGDSCPATDVFRASRKPRLRTKPALRRQQGKSGSGRSCGRRGREARELIEVLKRRAQLYDGGGDDRAGCRRHALEAQ